MGKLKNILRAAATGSFTLLLAACYGVAYDQETMSGKVKVLDGEGNPIEGLSLSLVKNDMDPNQIRFTDAEGIGEWGGMDPYSEYSLIIEDIDGPANGGEFQKKEITVENNTPFGDFDSIAILDEV